MFILNHLVICIHILFQIISHYRLLQNIEQSFLCYAVDTWLSILYILVVCIHFANFDNITEPL